MANARPSAASPAAALIVDFLAARGVDRVFGLQGGHIQPIWDVLGQRGIRIVDVRDEGAGSGPIRLLDPEGSDVPDGGVGELFSRTPYVFDGYWKNPEKTAEAFRGAWRSVGDLARRDANGYYHLVDRKSNMIISGGENIDPSEVESLLGGHDAVKDVAVLGLPDAKWGEAVHAVVVLHAGARATEAELLGWCRDRIAGYKRPRGVTFLEDHEMPRTATGKILHRVLRERLAMPD